MKHIKTLSSTRLVIAAETDKNAKMGQILPLVLLFLLLDKDGTKSMTDLFNKCPDNDAVD